MCGIAGILAPDSGPAALADLVRPMLAVLWHRGPDGQGILCRGGLCVGAVRLAIVDVGGGAQPMVARAPDGRELALVYNGEVYNHLRLRPELEAAGWRFRTGCDTETVLAACAIWGDAAPERFDGMFAYALCEFEAGRVTLVRDRFGIKPLYLARPAGGGLAFASEPKALLAAGVVSGRPDPLGLLEIHVHGAAFPAGAPLSRRTVYAGIEPLSPGTWLRIDAAGGRVGGRFFNPATWLQGEPFSGADEAVEALRVAFGGAIEDARMGEARVGTALSGGLDSSLITAELCHRQARVVSSTITWDTDRRDGDAVAAAELHTALRSAGYPHELRWSYASRDVFLHDVDTLVGAFDEPCWEPRKLGMLGNYRRLRAAGCKVALSGEGADELFFGYWPRFAGWRPQPPMEGPGDFAAWWRGRLGDVERLFAPAFASGLLAPEAPAALVNEAVGELLAPHWQRPADRERAVQLWYMQTFLHWLLADNDRFGMRWSIEARFPFLAAEVVDVALRAAPAWSHSDPELPDKALLRRVAADRLPDRLWRVRPKAPMPTPPDLRYHLAIADRLQAECDTAPASLAELFDLREIRRRLATFRETTAKLARTDPFAGELASRFHPARPVRTVHVFGLLTTIRWWRGGFSRPAC